MVTPPRIAGGAETILLVEDDQSLANLFMLLLQRAGFVVRHARNGAECRAEFAAHQASIGLLVMDCGLPDAHGGTLSHELRAAVPQLPVLLTSGRQQGALVALLAADGPTGFLAKPFLPAEVTRQVRALLPSAAVEGEWAWGVMGMSP
eukprot:gene62946-86096_t